MLDRECHHSLVGACNVGVDRMRACVTVHAFVTVHACVRARRERGTDKCWLGLSASIEYLFV